MKKNNTSKVNDEGVGVKAWSISKLFKHMIAHWAFYSSVSLAFVIILAIRGMIVRFSGDVSMAVEFVQVKLLSGILMWVVSLFVGLALISAIFLIPIAVARKLLYKITSKAGTDRRRWGGREWWYFLLFLLLNFLLASIVFVMMMLYLAGGSYKYIWQAFLESYGLIIFSSSFYSLVVWVYKKFNSRSDLYIRNVFVIILGLLLIWLFVSPNGTMDIMNGGYGKGVSCVEEWDHKEDKNPSDKKVDALPVEYDARGVHVFTGDHIYVVYDGSVTDRWENVRREYIQFEKGYKVTSGACKPSSNASSKQIP